MRCVAIIAARLSSERLPNKVLLQVPPGSGVSMLEMVVRKVLLAKTVDDVVVVTPDKFIVQLCARWNVRAHLPSWKERDVVREYYEAAMAERASVIVRITADCPLISPEVIDEVVGVFMAEQPDIAYNTDESTGQLNGEGSDIEVFDIQALRSAEVNAQGEEREHATLWIRRNTLGRFVDGAPLGIRSINTFSDYEWLCQYLTLRSLQGA